LKCLNYLHEVVHTNFSVDFWILQFLTAISPKIVAPPSNGNATYIVRLKWQWPPKKRWNCIKINP